MIVLALDTSMKTASIALLKDSEVVAEIFLHSGAHHSVVLLPAMESILNHTNIHLEDVDLFSCTSGPGSFTGIRIGMGTLKGIALAMNKPVVGVSTLDALAFNMVGSTFLVCPMFDARKNQVYTSLYMTDRGEGFEKLVQDSVVDIAEIGNFFQEVEKEIVFLGDGALKYARLIEGFFKGKCHIAPPLHHSIRASVVALLGEKQYRQGISETPLTISPTYLRASDAELKKATVRD